MKMQAKMFKVLISDIAQTLKCLVLARKFELKLSNRIYKNKQLQGLK